jgi:hypothetical protein
LFVSHFTEFTLWAGQAKRNKTLDRGIRASPLRLPHRALKAPRSREIRFEFLRLTQPPLQPDFHVLGAIAELGAEKIQHFLKCPPKKSLEKENPIESTNRNPT